MHFQEMKELCDSMELREKMSRRMKKLIDGRGAENIVRAVIKVI